MLQPVKFAHVVTLVCIVWQVLYLVGIMVAPGVVYFYLTSMVPGYDLSVIESTDGIDFGMAMIGLVLMAISVWLSVYATIWFYNRWAK